MKPAQLMTHYANLAQVHDALGLLVQLNVLTGDDRIRLTRKFMEDRPEFKNAVQEAMNAGLHTGETSHG